MEEETILKDPGILGSVEDNCLVEKIISVFISTGINMKSNDIEACRRIVKSQNS